MFDTDARDGLFSILAESLLFQIGRSRHRHFPCACFKAVSERSKVPVPEIAALTRRWTTRRISPAGLMRERKRMAKSPSGADGMVRGYVST
jgi:hypothetical protein